MSAATWVWSLVRWSSGATQPFGAQPQGTLVYTADGTMIACFMRRDRAPLGPGMNAYREYLLGRGPLPPEDAGELERRFARSAMSFNAYSGRYSVEDTLVHHDVEIALFADWIGKRLSRTFEIDQDRLALSFGVDKLTWSRRRDADPVL